MATLINAYRSTMPHPIRQSGSGAQDLLLREFAHRSVNDMQMVAGLLTLQLRKALSEETRAALENVRNRVMVLANARAGLLRDARTTLDTALQQVCVALQSQAEPYGVTVTYASNVRDGRLSSSQIMSLSLAVNELATNALKHGFGALKGDGKGDGKADGGGGLDGSGGGSISITAHMHDADMLTITVEDDGAAFTALSDRRGSGFGLDLVRRLIESARGLVIMPTGGGKCFEIRVPLTGND